MTLGLGLGAVARPWADLSRSKDVLPCMLWSWTPVVPIRGWVLPSLVGSSPTGHTRSATTNSSSLTGLNPFTLVALRPARPLSTLRGLPRGSASR